jgi:peroxiredoxin
MTPFRLASRSLLLCIALVLGACDSRVAAPAVTYTLLDGRSASSASWPGKVMLVNFWATSCAVCVREMPQLAALHQRLAARGYDTLAVAMAYDPPAHVANFVATRSLPFGVAIDNTGVIARAFGDVRETPTSVLVDKQGRIVRRYVGAPDFDALRALVEQLLAEG